MNSVEQLQTLPKTQSEIDISPFLKTQKPSIGFLPHLKIIGEKIAKISYIKSLFFGERILSGNNISFKKK